MSTLINRRSFFVPYFSIPRLGVETLKAEHFIEPTHATNGINPIELDYYVTFIEEILRNLLPQELLTALTYPNNSDLLKEQIAGLSRQLPLLMCNEIDSTPATFCVFLLCPSENTAGVGRYVCDILSRWLVPGKLMNISSIRSLNFQFLSYPEKRLYFHQVLLDVETEEDLNVIKAQWESLQQELHLSILMASKTEKWDADIFHEIRYYIQSFGNPFTAIRDLKHVSRLISFLHLFRKNLTQLIQIAPEERHLKLKLFFQKGSKVVFGIAGGINLLRENELLEERHITEAVLQCIPGIRYVKDSLVLDRRSNDPIRLFYLEIEKENGEELSLKEFQELKKGLPRSLIEGIKTLLNPVFIPRNEEEIMRNILLLSQQLKYIGDLPQVMISYNTQTKDALHFTVILLRIRNPKHLSVEELFLNSKTPLKIKELEVKQAGLLRKKHLKEANILKVSLDKADFLRKDTIDLFKARQAVSSELHEIFQGIRDFNGGIFSKQQEVFQQLKHLVQKNTLEENFLLENFFYSLTPSLKQTLLSPSLLKRLFSLMQEALEIDYTQQIFSFKTLSEEKQLFIVIGSTCTALKNELFALVAKLQIPPQVLCRTQIDAYGITCIGFLYQHHEMERRALFSSALHSYLEEWESHRKN